MSRSRKFDRNAILTNRSLPEVYNSLVDLAQEFAVLGEVDTARTLISLLLRDTTSDWQRNQIRHLEPFFAETNQWPDEIPEKERIEEKSDKVATKHPRDADDDDAAQDDETQLQELLKRARDNDPKLGHRVPTSNPVDALAIAVRLTSKQTSDVQEVEKDSKVQEALGLISDRLHKPRTIGYLAGRHEICPLLSTGALARKLPIDKDKIHAFGKEVVETFSERFTNGRKSHESESLSTKDLLLELERNTKANSTSHYEEMGDPIPETLFVQPPATDEQISNLEKRLEVTLPDDYKEFLKLSNGFGGTWNGYHPDPPLFGVDDVEWDDPDLAIPYLELHESISGTFDLELSERKEWPDSGQTVKIGYEDVLSVHLIPPKQTKNILEAYQEAMDGLATSDAMKQQALKTVKSRYGSWEELQKLEWSAVEQHDSDTLPYGTFRMLLEERLRKSMNEPYTEEGGKEKETFAYSCLADSS
ncbi:hypothetical protein NW762_008404 [Fusarium torreyae]|uniref:Knr4/Smi1-like domain-containing protein n=1 Tax=Fusarium torreyae TaxID=1237075 RepID=A0A9W8RZE8_9HYPO|nr:hypothetical protein NW762_008404 [Fusarium torreyae]